MTTGNNILANQLDSVLHVPLEAIHNLGDSMVFVYIKDGWGITKQEVVVGETNENNTVVNKGVRENDMVLLSIPPDEKSLKIARLTE